ncbi:hypothetical protein RSAG8_09172, partial [Rhizoctonia solani AG-8 WAC10335]
MDNYCELQRWLKLELAVGLSKSPTGDVVISEKRSKLEYNERSKDNSMRLEERMPKQEYVEWNNK